MKRRELMRHLARPGCTLIREGGHHSWRGHVAKNRRSAAPRPTAVPDLPAKKLGPAWDVPNP